jgi:replicative DNA helicase
VKPNWFQVGNQRKIYQAILKVTARGADPDITNVFREDETISPSYLSELTQTHAIAENALDYITQLKEEEDKKELEVIGGQLIDLARRKDTNTEEIKAELEKRITDLEMGICRKYIDAKQWTAELTDVFIGLINNNAQSGIESGMYPIDEHTAGFNPGELVIIGARPGIGKTAFALAMATHQAMRDFKVGFISAEMDRIQLGKRIVAGMTPILMTELKSAACKKKIMEIGGFLEQLHGKYFFVDDTPNPSLERVISTAREMKRKEDIQILYVDYLSLIQVKGQMPMWEKVGMISGRMKQLARELQIPVICLSQVGRETEGKAPGLADLRYAGAIEQDADVIIFIHRERKPKNPGGERPTDVDVAKNRQGKTGGNQVEFCPEITWFRNYRDKYMEKN